MSHYYLDLNGRLLREGQAQISVFDSALLYGQGVFETLRAVEGKVLFLDRHLDRLARSGRGIGLPLPVTRNELTARIGRLLRRNRLKEAYLRINISRWEEDVGRRRAKGKGFHVIIFARPFHPYPERCTTQGARLILVQSVVNDSLPLANLKTTNYLTKILARQEVRCRKADEGILLNGTGHLTEGTSSNIFIVTQDKIVTPPLSEGVMPGVTRDLIGELCPNLVEQSLTPADLATVQEIFITSTLKGVMPVGWWEGKRLIPSPGPITRQLMAAYRKSSCIG